MKKKEFHSIQPQERIRVFFLKTLKSLVIDILTLKEETLMTKR